MIPPLPPFPAMCVFCFPFASRMQLRGIPVFLPGPVRHAVLLTPSLSSRLPRPFRNGSPNSLGIISFADHHPLIPLESYRFKTMGARRPSCSSNFQPSTFDFQPPSLSKPFSCNTYGSPRNCWALLTSSAQFSLRGVDKEKVTVFSNEAGGMMAEVGLLPFARVALQVATRILPPYRTRFSKPGRKSLRPCWTGVLGIRWFDPIAEASELSDHSRRAPLLRLFGDGWAPFFIANSLVQD